MNFDAMSFEDLQILKSQVEHELQKREHEEKSKARKQILELARIHGLDVEEVLSTKAAVARKPVEAKYQNPAQADQTWTGRGRKPKWVEDQLANGKSLDDLLIKA